MLATALSGFVHFDPVFKRDEVLADSFYVQNQSVPSVFIISKPESDKAYDLLSGEPVSNCGVYHDIHRRVSGFS